ncbi:MAG: endopeptidase La, partial [Oscillospiraceae bacterium]|nr:endopeptidase La [Oscillospiraceae bacterium]
DLLEKLIYENLEMVKLNQEASNARQEDYQKIYRESAIKQQLEYLQKELDEMHPENVSDIRKFEIKIEESGMNDAAKGEAVKVLNRIKQEGQHSAETGMLYDYLDFLTSLSWKKEQAEKIDLDHAEKVLEEDHFGLKKVKERIIQQIAVMDLKKQQTGSILLFVGAPGTGKTSIGQSIARALQLEYVRVSLGGVRDEADIRGHRRTYIGAMPGRIMDGIRKSGVSNPVMVLDEVDKLSVSYNGDPASALLEVLDPEQNNTFTDHYMNVPYDLSDVMFICTANTVDTIPEPLLNRMEVIQFQGYSPIEKYEIAKQHLIPKAKKLVGLENSQVEITDDAIRVIISDYTRESGVRGLKKRMDTLCRAAAVELVKGNEDQVVITAENLRKYLDMHPLHHQHVMETADPGIVTGLAWTSVGGEILYIETMLTKGNGKVTITGQLGDVMRESAQIAVSLVKHAYPDSAKILEENDLHIHVPDGSTPKDGPSAGITLTTAIASLVTGCPVDPHIAMTGEVSLRGNVNAIGGLPEKLMAAQRAGVKKVLIPKDNVEDLEDVPEEVKEQLEIIPVETVKEVLGLCSIQSEIISVA